MAASFKTTTKSREIFDNMNPIFVELIVLNINNYLTLQRSTTAEEVMAAEILGDVQTIAPELLYACLVRGDNKPIESMIGLLASALLGKNKEAVAVVKTHHVVAELILSSTSIFKQTKTLNGHLKVASIFFDSKLAAKELFALPNFNKPTQKHKKLGKVEWTSTYTDAVDKLNSLPLVLLDFDEEVIQPSDSEEYNKYAVRKAIMPTILGTEMFFDWNQDYRGRMYPSGYHLNPQGNEYEKNIFAFGYYEDSTLTSLNEVKMAISRAFGKDKMLDRDKVLWFDHNEKELRWQDAKEPTTARAQLESLRLIRTTGMTNIPVELDGTNSQLQIIAALTGDLKTAQMCNVITDNTHIQDAYHIMASEMSRITGKKFNRQQLKKSMMIDGYGAGTERIMLQLKEDLGDRFEESDVVAFYIAQQTVSPMTSILKETFKTIWDSNRTRYQWTLPNGFVTDYQTVQSKRISITPFGQQISMIVNAVLPTSKNTGLGVNIIHSVDAYVCSEMVIRCRDILTIHDGFRVLPKDAPKARQVYADILAEITDSTLLEDIIEEISGCRIKLTKQFTGNQVRVSKYAIC